MPSNHTPDEVSAGDTGAWDRRNFLGVAGLGTVLGLAGCSMPVGARDQGSAGAWSDASDGQQAVMLLGSIHLAVDEDGAGGNAFVTDPGDVLGAQRQRELETLTDRIAAWEPDQVAVEHPLSEQAALNTAYDAFRDDDLDGIPDGMSPESEVVQIGCRLAAKLDHDSVRAVDYPQRLDALMTDAERETLPPLQSFIPDPDSVPYPLPDPRVYPREKQTVLDEQGLLALYRYLNQPDHVRTNDQLLFAGALEASDRGDYTPIKVLTAWYQRNLRIVSNLWNSGSTDADRVLLLFGAAHVPGLKHMLSMAPMFAPVDPTPYLQPA